MNDEVKSNGSWSKHYKAMELKLGRSLISDEGELAQTICEYQETHPDAPMPFFEVNEAMLRIGDHLADFVAEEDDGMDPRTANVSRWRNYRAFQNAFAETYSPEEQAKIRILENHRVSPEESKEPASDDPPMVNVLTYAKQARVFLLKAQEILDEHDTSENGALAFWADKTRRQISHFVSAVEHEVAKGEK